MRILMSLSAVAVLAACSDSTAPRCHEVTTTKTVPLYFTNAKGDTVATSTATWTITRQVCH